MAGTDLVRCTLPAPDGGEVIVTEDICGVLGGYVKGTPSEPEAMNWQATARSTLQQRLPAISAQNRAAVQAAIARLG